MAVSKIWQALTSAAGPAAPAEPAEMLRDLYGTGPRGGINTGRAAEKLGVSRRTVQRWARDGIPANPSGRSLRQRHNRWNRSTAGQTKALGPAGEQMRRRGAGVTFTGKIKISGGDSRSTVSRSTGWALSSDDMALVLDAAVTGSRADLQAALEHVSQNSFGGGSLQLDIDTIKFT